MTTTSSGVYASGSYGITSKSGRGTLRIWFCGGKHQPLARLGNITEAPCAHRSRDEARACPNANR